MSLTKRDPGACPVHLFGTQPLADSPLTLPFLNTLRGNFSGPRDCEAYGQPGSPTCKTPEPPVCRLERNPVGLATLVYPVVKVSVRISDETGLTPLAGPPDSLDPNTISTCPLVKLRVSSEQWEGPLWVDCDREVVVPAPHVCVDVTTPATWLTDPPQTARQGNSGDLVWDVFLQLKICRAFCCRSWPPIVTEQFTADAEVPTDTVRPRGARKLAVGMSSVGPVDLTAFQGDPGAGGIAVAVMRRTLGAPIDLAPLPSFTHVRFPAVIGTPRVIYSWEVAP